MNLGLLKQLGTRAASVEVCKALRAQNSPPTPLQEEYLQALEAGKAACIFTGQQVGLCLGPLLTFYKILSVLELVKRQQAQSTVRLVPIFWVQSEDHDLAEIDSLSQVDAEGILHTIHLQTENERISNRTSVGALTLPQNTESVLNEFLQLKTSAERDESALELFRKHYRAGVSYAKAFAALASELLASRGLLLFDPRDKAIASAAAPLYLRALEENEIVSETLLTQASALEKGGEQGFVHIRPNSPLFFLHPSGPDGPRFRVEQSDAKTFALSETKQSFQLDELKEKIQTTPDSFSTSALLRPLLQNFLFPTLAYVGGPAEMRYWKQIEPLHRLWEIPFPLLVPRKRALLVEPKVRRLIAQLELSNAELELDANGLKTLLLARVFPKTCLPEAVDQSFNSGIRSTLKNMMADLQSADAGAANELSRSHEKIERALQGFADKLQELATRKAQVSIDRLERLGNFISPQGTPQERICAFATFWCKYGNRLVELVEAAMANSDDNFVIVEL